MTDLPSSTVHTDTLSAHAARVSSAVDALDPDALARAARRVAAATPGSLAAVAAEALAARWASTVRAWAVDVGRHGDALGRSARACAETDHDLAASMRARP